MQPAWRETEPRDGEKLGPDGTLWAQNSTVGYWDFSVKWANTICFALTDSIISIIGFYKTFIYVFYYFSGHTMWYVGP